MIKKGDFIRIKYTGYKDGKVFDTSDKELAEKEGISHVDNPVVIVGEHFVLPGLEESLEGRKVGDKYEVDVPPAKGFGERNPKLMKLVPLNDFKKNNLNPFPGMPLDLDGIYGVVKTVSGGRVIVDFNHPLAGKELKYKVEIVESMPKDEDKIKGVMDFFAIKEYEIKEKDVLIKKKLAPAQKMYLEKLFKKYIKDFVLKFEEQ